MPLRILIADDHTLVRAGLRALLESNPGVVVVAETGSGREALELVERHRPDLALLDISMPELSGLEVAERLAKTHPHTKVIIAGEKAVPAHEEPRHRLVFANRFVRVLDVFVPAGETTAYHRHDAPLVAVSVQEARTRDQAAGGEPGPVGEPRELPALRDNWERALPYTHRVSNVDTVPFRYIVGEWLASPGLEPVITPAVPALTLVKDGKTARIHRVTLAPGGATARHTHAAPGLTVLGVPGELVAEGDAGAAIGGEGLWGWRNAGHEHALRNAGTVPITVYEIDWR